MRILDTVGNTPMIELANITRMGGAQVLCKVERTNPGGSIKDRPAKFIIEEAERRGWLKPGGTIIESSSGNFGISLAMIGAAKGYRVLILVDPKTTAANLALLRCFGAEVIVVTEQDDTGSYHKTRIALANKLARDIENAFRPDQCFSLLNSEAHYQSTAREILRDCAGEIDAIVAAVSTGGQLGGISRYIKTYRPEIRMVGVDAEGSAAFGGQPHAYKIPGIGLGWTPANLRLEQVDCAYKVTDEQAFVTARCVARNEGLLIGPSSGACVLVALRLAQCCASGKRIVCVVSDGGERYIHTLFNDGWMAQQGFSIANDMAALHAMLQQVQPWSECPAGQAVCPLKLDERLGVPPSTKASNREVSHKKRRATGASFMD